MNSPDTCIDSYRSHLSGQLCWIDGEPTHASSETQRQCPRCRVKWSYVQIALEFAIFEQFCNGERARRAAENLGCSRNTVNSHYRSFTGGMENLVAKMLLEGTIATNPQSIEEVIKLEKALRVGSTRRRATACRYLFLSSLDGDDRARRLFPETLGRQLTWRIKEAKMTQTFEEARKRKPKKLMMAVGTYELESARNLRPKLQAPRHGLMEEIGRELSAFIERNYPPQLPSRACIELGEVWVKVWNACREVIKYSHKG
jgi:hypothetical protein